MKGVSELVPGVRVRDGESFESALRRFKRICEQEGILSEIKKHQHFEKPSEKKKKRLLAAKRKIKRFGF
ncbi:MAG: 30S ribosomal protein S21 [Candidatus Cloacimonadota bacterium]|nr:MAG: 30S ribosomal protein S21 [Candidatus Cloacimonadota bacterium]